MCIRDRYQRRVRGEHPKQNMAEQPRTYGFVGMGQMGAAMSENMLKAGLKVVVWNRTAERCDPLREHGGVVAATPAELYAQCDVIFNMLSTPAITQEFYQDHVLSACSGKDVIECATVGPACTISLGEAVTTAGGRFLEAPVAGHSGQAAAKTIAFLCAGDRQVFDRAAPAFGAMSKGQHFFGEEVGAASRMKLVVNSMLGTFASSMAEALAVADKAGLSQEHLMNVVMGHPMGSPYLKLVSGMMIADNHLPALFMAKHEAVSYTHLRAHETVLDLVCRLLLEKKK
eukprot:TRINITY_DN17935_c0_g1_i2.p1 TRINITY_DN17935_c0_g1~~TRINITY_DN17935_c0_g1_i2.p1  ORF type:complete len:286 (+),score=63.98 TRINITY_DN17935_c0_g1_i2:100-957(+)